MTTCFRVPHEETQFRLPVLKVFNNLGALRIRCFPVERCNCLYAIAVAQGISYRTNVHGPCRPYDCFALYLLTHFQQFLDAVRRKRMDLSIVVRQVTAAYLLKAH